MAFSRVYFFCTALLHLNYGTIKGEQRWERTNVTNLLRNRQSEKYYARVKVNGKQKWRTLKTEVFSVAKLRLAHRRKDDESSGSGSQGESAPGAASETTVELLSPPFHLHE